MDNENNDKKMNQIDPNALLAEYQRIMQQDPVDTTPIDTARQEARDLQKTRDLVDMGAELNKFLGGPGINTYGKTLARRQKEMVEDAARGVQMQQDARVQKQKDIMSLLDVYSKLERLKAKPTQKTTDYQQSDYVRKGSGAPVVFDKLSGSYIDYSTKEMVPPKEVERKITKTITDPLTGEIRTYRAGIGAGGNIFPRRQPAVAPQPQQIQEVLDSVSKNRETPKEAEKPELTPRQIYQTFNPKDIEKFNKEKTSFDSETKAQRESLRKVDRVAQKSFEAQTNPIAAAQLGAEVATIFENGRLTDEDVLRYTRRVGLLDRFTDALRSAADGTITAEKAKLIRETLEKYSEDARGELNDFAKKRAKRLSNTLSTDFSKNSEDLVPLFYENISTEKPEETSDEKKDTTKKITKREYSASRNKTRITYDDGSQEIVDGRQD